MRSFLFLLVCLVYFSSAQAQKNQNVYFLKYNGQEVLLKDSADFIRVIQEPDSGSTNFKVLEYYSNNSRRFIGEVSSFTPHLVFEGSSIRFYKNGQKEKLVNYKDGMPVGTAYYFHTNGKIHKVLEHGAEGVKVIAGYNKTYYYKLLSYRDSTGTELVKDGVGHVIETDSHLTEEGDYQNGMREGKWKFKRLKNEVSSEEIYKNGKFISGITINADGSTVPYLTLESLPEFKGGITAFNHYLSKNIQYPLDAQRQGITGKVFVSFVIEADGTMTDIKLLKSLHPSLDREALRIIRRSPKWKPGYQHGIPVRVVFTQPIAFNL